VTDRNATDPNDVFRLALEAAPTGMLMIDRNGRITLVNAQIERLFGYDRTELIGRQLEQLVPERFRERHPDSRESFFGAPQTRAMGIGRELFGLRKDGSEVPVEIGLTPVHTREGDFVLSSIVDITERRRSLEQLRERTADLTASLRERDVLLQEVHHRVKNNLQLITSLINLQMRKLESSTSREVLAECKRRVDAIGLIHDQLYQSRDYAQVPFSDYARRIASNIVNASETSASGIELEFRSDALSLPVDKAISCGLILTELITNALKHAYPPAQPGKLSIHLLKSETDQARLIVKDSGVGMQETHRNGRASSLGFHLINTLTEQLDGTLTIEVAAGTSVTVAFPVGD
jgi:two-component system, sensor histidine kinase PdtaS